jgi:hypothetical protein
MDRGRDFSSTSVDWACQGRVVLGRDSCVAGKSERFADAPHVQRTGARDQGSDAQSVAQEVSGSVKTDLPELPA